MEATDGDSGVPEVQGASEGQGMPSAQEAGMTGVHAQEVGGLDAVGGPERPALRG